MKTAQEQAREAVVATVTAEVNRRLLPAVIANESSNAAFVTFYLTKHNLEFNADNVVAAVWAGHSAGRILWLVDPVAKQPKVLTPAQQQAVDLKAAQKEMQDIIASAPLSAARQQDKDRWGRSDADQIKRAKDAQVLSDAKQEVAREINRYSRGHLGRMDYAGTESGQKKLREVAGNYEQLNDIAAVQRVLETVKREKSRLPS